MRKQLKVKEQKSEQKNVSTEVRIKWLKHMMLLSGVLIIFLLAAIISVLTIKKTDTLLKAKVTSMTSTLNVQMQMNLNSYLQRMETIGTLVFAEEEVYQYSAVDSSNDEYEAIKTEQLIADKLYDLCIMENFVDFAIVYSNNHPVGKMSNGTVELFGDNLYRDLKAMINRQKTADGWSTGYQENYKRIYYVKRVNEDAVLVISFYTNELDDVFEHPGGIDDIAVQLVEANGIVIYSSDDGQEGQVLDPAVAERIDGRSAVTMMDDEYLITLKECGDNWSVVCSTPTQKILKEKNDVTFFVIIVTIIAAVVASLLNVLLISRIINPVHEIVDSLSDEAHNDLLTGIFNKKTFEKKVEEALKRDQDLKKKAVILLDLDNFKGVNDTLGHAYGDKVLAGVGDILRRVSHADDYLGRLGGDEFCIYLNILDFYQGNYREYIEEKCKKLCQAFSNNYTGENGNYKISASIGVAIFPDHGTSFSELYKCADKALYASKHKGKDTYTIYEESLPEKEEMK